MFETYRSGGARSEIQADHQGRKVFTKELLIRAIREGELTGYNRQLNWAVLDKIGEEGAAVVSSMPHDHIYFVQVETHVRVGIIFGDERQFVVLDVSQELYDELPQETE